MAYDGADVMDEDFTVERLQQWNSNNNALPKVDTIRELHVYDFDNTIFITPLPNRNLWDGSSIGRLQDIGTLAEGGWWHNAAILSATGQGIDIEEPRAWDGHWNENIVELIRLSMAQKDALTVLLTGRSDGAFASLVQRICKSKQLQFDIYGLKPTVPRGQPFRSTIAYKEEFLTALMRTYPNAKELRIYEDRIAHVDKFRKFFVGFNYDMSSMSIPRGTINAQVIHVVDLPGTLDPVAEVAAVQTLVNSHNELVRAGEAGPRHTAMKIHKQSLYSAYQVKTVGDTENLLKLVALPKDAQKLANSVLITTYVADEAKLQKVGGLGKVVRFQVIAIGFIPDRIWAAEVRSIGANAFTTLPKLQIVLALNNGARPSEAREIRQWHPIPSNQSIQFDTVVSEVYKLSLREEQLPSTSGPIHQNSIIPAKRDADHFKEQRDPQARPPRGRVDARGGGRRGGGTQPNTRGGYVQKGGNAARGAQNQRGRGGRGNRDASGRRGGYKDHDAATRGGKPGNERNMHNDY